MIQYDKESPLLGHILNNARRYINLFASAIDSLLPAPTVDVQSEVMPDVLDVIMTQRRRMNEMREDGAGGDAAEAAAEMGEQLFPPELLRR